MSQEQSKDMSQYFYRASAADFMKIPGSPVAYWVSDAIRNIFTSEKLIGEVSDTAVGLFTCDNARFLRSWHEVGLHKIGFSVGSREAALKSGKKYFPYNKGGGFRRWYGLNDLIVQFDDDGKEIRQHREASGQSYSLPGERYYFRKGITWSGLTSSTNSFRYSYEGFVFESNKGQMLYSDDDKITLASLNSKVTEIAIAIINPTISLQSNEIKKTPRLISADPDSVKKNVINLLEKSKYDWDSFETSWDFRNSPLIRAHASLSTLKKNYQSLHSQWRKVSFEMQHLEQDNNRLFIEAYGLQDELTPDVPLEEITLTCNPHYRYGGNRSEEELETLLQCDTLRELVSYAIGCMMGRYSLDKPGLILASQGETLQDYLRQIPSPRFAPDDDAILPLTDQEWFADDATNRFREFIRVVWGGEHLQENLDFVAESLCLHAIKPLSRKAGGESALDTIRRYLSTQFFKDHLRTYKKRPIYWLFSSGKHKAFECLVYLHRYHEGTLARMRTEYVIPLSAKLNSYAEKLEQDRDASTSAAETKRLEKELSTLHKQQAELAEFDEKLRHYADQRIRLDLDDGVKVNYGKFGDLLAEVKAVTGDV